MSYIPAGHCQELSGWTDAVKKIGSGIWGTIQTYGAEKGKAEAYKELVTAQQAAAMAAPVKPPMPAWIVPAGIGAAALVAVLVLTKRK